MNIIWSDAALTDFEENILYILEDWNEQVALDFTSETERILEIISQNPKAFKRHKKKNTHIVPVTRQITLFYDVKGKEIHLLRFWNNYQNPKRIVLK